MLFTKEQEEKLHAELDGLGEAQVRIRFRTGYWARPEKRAVVEEWLRQKDQAHEDEHRDESLEIAREANDISRSAKNWSRWAVFFSGCALLVAAYVAFLK